MRNFYFQLVFLFLICSKIFSQELIQVTDETLTVNSVSAINGHTRNTAEITLPEKTKGYIYRISVTPKGSNALSNSLFDLLQTIGSTNISLTSSFAKYAIKNGDNNSVDAFIFDNVVDANNFLNKRDGHWSLCKSMLNRVSCCFASQECIGRKVYFGFRNNNAMQGLNVRLEIVALVDQSLSANYKYSYPISNTTDKEVRYLISTDNINWEEIQLRNGYKFSHLVSVAELYFKITTLRKSVAYKITPNERYKIYWNTNGYLDLTRY
ncbi:hypothetical protein [Flavobacterium sp.]|uniref:hypothetical protein n=1 Tax=Flavobacterium sp. TaxID=239 RepID=UPI00120832AD|nr:hypothetical protein [Flavobacterium sp.]RZJ71450.1 MAG: hypothetical protein EOO49_10345 [Flavobacterium sp.]